MTNLAVIPARGGSKRIPRKNVRNFCGLPMIAWSINAAKKSNCFDRIVVSTDDDEIAEVAMAYGALVPFIRPAELSDDHTGTTPVIAHAIDWHITHDVEPQNVCCIYATAPFLRAEDLRRGYELLCSEQCDYVFTVAEYSFPIQRAIRLRKDGRLEMREPDKFSTRSQDLEPAYHDAGQFYWGRSGAWIEGKPLFAPSAAPLVLPSYRVQDIDTMDDWQRAELMHTSLQKADPENSQ